MTYVIMQHCCNDAACVPVCPVDCIHPRPDEQSYAITEMLYIDPDVCVDCGACLEVCPVDAIRSEYDLTPSEFDFQELNAAYFLHQPPSAALHRAVSRPQPRPTPAARPLRVAVVGSGPAGCYASRELLESDAVSAHVDMFERLLTPWGLIRFGVAPDHLATKRIVESFEGLTRNPRFRLWLNVEIGRDVTPDQLSERYDAVIYAFGAMDARNMNIPGEDLPGSRSATEFVAWYNGHPDFADRTFDLSGERAVVIGNGNVAIDIARVLLSTPEELQRSDIAPRALQEISNSKIREVVVVGRRGPAEAAFTNGELLGLLAMPRIDVVFESVGSDVATRDVQDLDFAALQKLTRLRGIGDRHRQSDRRVVLSFGASPQQVLGQDRVTGVRLLRNELVASPSGVRAVSTDETRDLDCGLLIRSVGYQGKPLAGLPFDPARAVIPNADGRIVDPETGSVMSGAYVTGWIKRGPSGVIGTNKQCARETVGRLVDDFLSGKLREPPGEPSDLKSQLPEAVDVDAWRAIDEHEREEGAKAGRPRVKLVDQPSLLGVARAGTKGADR